MPVSDIFSVPLTSILPVNQRDFLSLTGDLPVSDKFSKQHHSKEFPTKIKRNNHKQKISLRFMDDAHKDSSANRGNIFHLFIYSIYIYVYK